MAKQSIARGRHESAPPSPHTDGVLLSRQLVATERTRGIKMNEQIKLLDAALALHENILPPADAFDYSASPESPAFEAAMPVESGNKLITTINLDDQHVPLAVRRSGNSRFPLLRGTAASRRTVLRQAQFQGLQSSTEQKGRRVERTLIDWRRPG
jgi:hypothetical protein